MWKRHLNVAADKSRANFKLCITVHKLYIMQIVT